MAEKIIGKVIHYYDKIGVIVVRLEDSVAVGDTIKVVRGDDGFEESVASMQIEYKEVESAKKGEEVAIKVSQRSREGATVYKVE